MDLEQLENEQVQAPVVNVDVLELTHDVEEISELAADVESSLNTVNGLIAMEETFDAITIGDQESITDNQLTAFRAGMATTMIAANGNLKAAFGIDTEATYVDATSAYAKDVEGIKEFFKKIWEKIKKGLIKANAFFRKMFLKFLNMVTFRKGTIEKLQEDVDAATTGNETLKASKHGVVKKLAAAASISGTLNGDTIKFGTVTAKAMYAGALDNNAVAVMSQTAGTLSKELKGAVESGNNEKIEGAFSKLAELGGDIVSIKDLEKIDSSTTKKFKKADVIVPIRVSGSKLYLFGVTSKTNVITGTASVKADKVKVLEGLTSTLVSDVLKTAATANEDFKDIVNGAFEAYDDAETLAEAFEGIKLPENTTPEHKAAIKSAEKMGKQLSSATPWIAFHTSMGVYKAVGYSIGLAKAYLKDVKEEDK